ncbi:endospore germination permease [Thermosyntropha sp.]|uniref:GerAB/ArcD/ProY family transporter n=1 Tax=Thermosyntropha sp. TaxID=2740820 RepID=UPI0025D25437|nr:endospore germination permease [Thermosyntropha sp.]MBO8159130.1 endospore germination permease [Thermosyntropha sp.]
MDKDRFEITPKQLVFLVVGSEVATGILSLPRVLSAEAGHYAWLAVILGVTVPVLSIYFIVSLYKDFSEPDFIKVSQLLFGRFLGFVIVVLFSAYIVFFQSIVIRIFAEITKTFLLPRTPIFVILFLILFSVYYAVSKGAKTVARLNEILFWILLVDLLVIIILIPQGDWTAFLPLNELNVTGLLKGAKESFYSYAGIEFLFVAYVMVNRKEKILKAAFTGQLIVLLLYLMVVVVSLLILGPKSLQYLIWPVLDLLSVRQIAVLERLEIVFLVFWLGIGARPVLNLNLASAYSICRLLKLDNRKYYIWVTLLVVLAIYIIALIPDNLVVVFKLADFAGSMFLLISLGLPVLCHIVKFFRKGRIGYEKAS